ncbi:GapA-binding peptide SR1P [Oceanobacillus massiliensis]|nr:GapA-binding peptide SR1P [Oceanobacillus massiliensis]
MGTIICKDCQQVIEHYEEEKVTTLYGTCPSCHEHN